MRRELITGLCSAVLLTVGGTVAHADPSPREPAATVDLTTEAGARLMHAAWRYSDARIVDIEFRAPDAQGQPTGPPVATHDITPHAGPGDFDDSAWPVIPATELGERRGTGRVSFNWYRVNVTVPERLGSFDPSGAALWLETRLDDYAEVWVDGELDRAYGQQGGSVVAGWNAVNRVLLGRHVRPGQKIQLAIFGMNAPISDAPTNYIFVREARLVFYPGTPGPVAVPPHEVNVRVERSDPAIDQIVPANAKLWKVAE
ncbi:MAG: hypothetical protein JO203_09245, partial [Gammaproteobacteria bacterium]|nr:hypothetical protein [Gammaproteobacteria bacterium]